MRVLFPCVGLNGSSILRRWWQLQNRLKICRNCWKLPSDTCWPKPIQQWRLHFNYIGCFQTHKKLSVTKTWQWRHFQWHIWQVSSNYEKLLADMNLGIPQLAKRSQEHSRAKIRTKPSIVPRGAKIYEWICAEVHHCASTCQVVSWEHWIWTVEPWKWLHGCGAEDFVAVLPPVRSLRSSVSFDAKGSCVVCFRRGGSRLWWRTVGPMVPVGPMEPMENNH